jgi:hypothetical protein
VATVPKTPVNPLKAFFITPIGRPDSETRKRSDAVLEHILRAGLVPDVVGDVERADEHANPGEITPVMVESILSANLIIADLTDSNANVYYEVALAHAFKKPTVHIQIAGQDLPFDLKDVRTIPYGLDLVAGDDARKAIRAAAEYAIANPEKITTPVARGAAILSGQASEDSGQQLAAFVATRLDEIERQLVRISRPTAAGRARGSQLDAQLDAWAEAWVAGQLADEALSDLAREGKPLPNELQKFAKRCHEEIGLMDEEIFLLTDKARQSAVNRARHPSRSSAVQSQIRLMLEEADLPFSIAAPIDREKEGD